MNVQSNLRQINDNIKRACEKVNRNPDEVTIIGVTKYVTIEQTKKVIDAGIKNIGENRVEGLTEKYNELQDPVKWHFIGTLQSRKARDVIDKVEAIHSLDRLSLAKQINNRVNKPMDCFIQVNISGEISKQGLPPHEVLPFIEGLTPYENIRIVGLMTMAPHVENEDELRHVFRELATLRDTIKNKKIDHAPCKSLSMGMSNDYEIAIEEGATHVRVGSKLVK